MTDAMGDAPHLLQESKSSGIAYCAGDVIVQPCDAILKVLRYSCVDSHCYYCLRCSPSLKPCTQCQMVKYCDIYCQLSDWENGHRMECGSTSFFHCFQSWAGEVQLLLMRLYAFVAINPNKVVTCYRMHDGTERCFNDLLTNEEQWTMDLQVQNACADLVRHMRAENLKVHISDFIRLFGFWQSNSFLINQDTEMVGCGIYIPCSIFDHSCKPTAHCEQSDGLFQVRALVNIPIGEQPTISYLHPQSHVSAEVRRQLLWTRYCFMCTCIGCRTEDVHPLNFVKLTELCMLMEAVMSQPTLLQDWDMVCSWHKSIMKNLRRLYHEFDYRITLHLTNFANFGKCMVGLNHDNVVRKVWEEARQHLLVLYGEGSSIYQAFTGQVLNE